MGSHERFLQILSMGFDHIVDIADNAHDEPKFTWRPDHYPVRHTHIRDFFDYGDPIPDSVFDTVAGAVFYALSVTGSKMLFHCSAGIRRSPNIMWGVLLGLGFSEVHAWRLIIEARPYAQAVLAYQNSAREWARRKR
jgi:protein-tyrosine phosphatase